VRVERGFQAFWLVDILGTFTSTFHVNVTRDQLTSVLPATATQISSLPTDYGTGTWTTFNAVAPASDTDQLTVTPGFSGDYEIRADVSASAAEPGKTAIFQYGGGSPLMYRSLAAGDAQPLYLPRVTLTNTTALKWKQGATSGTAGVRWAFSIYYRRVA
jgi:hypothetical protein